jgi:hypothetical protein
VVGCCATLTNQTNHRHCKRQKKLVDEQIKLLELVAVRVLISRTSRTWTTPM